jgi:hypothetical protein
MAIFASNLLLDPELTLKQFADGISQLPEQVREEIPFYATP